MKALHPNAARWLCLCVITTASPARSQDATASIFEKLSAAELISTSRELRESKELTQADSDAMAIRAIAILADQQDRATLDSNSLKSVLRLAEKGFPRLTPDQRELLSTAIESISSDGTSAELTNSFEWLHFLVSSDKASGDKAASQARIEQWVQSVGVAALTVEQLNWCLQQVLPQQRDRLSLSVSWTGTITPPRDGLYTFSVSSINVNKETAGGPIEHATVVRINDQVVVDASRSKWAWEGNSVQLSSTQPAKLEVEMTYHSREPVYRASPHCILYWSGPGMSRRPIGSEFFRKGTGEPGLTVRYGFSQGGEDRQLIQDASAVQSAWATCRNSPADNIELVSALTQRLYEASTAPEYISELIGPPRSRSGHPYFRNYTSSEYLSIAQKEEFLRILNATPELLSIANKNQILRLFHVLRFANEDEAMRMLGNWMSAHCDEKPVVAKHFFQQNRLFYRRIAAALALSSDFTELLDGFQESYLETPDGVCCLPVAYTLSYCYCYCSKDDVDKLAEVGADGFSKDEIEKVPRRRIDRWLELLTEKLDDHEIAGEQRVNWLLARAQAAELQDGVDTSESALTVSLLADRWMREAEIAASSQTALTRVYAEQLCRLVGANRLKEAEELLARAADAAPQEQVTRWTQKMAAVDASWKERRERDEIERTTAYRRLIEQRREKATSEDDQESAARYNELLQGMQAQK